MHYHLFICHADEDKSFARRLALALKKAGVAVWFDEDEIRLGSSIRQTIDRGLASAEFGLVVLSEVFFSKAWANRELNGLVAREMAEKRTVILPIWYEMTYDEVVRHSPLLADQRSLKFEGDLEEVVRQILDRLDLGRPYRQLHGSQRVHLTDRLGRRAMVSLTRKVQVGVEPLKEMLVRLPTSENYQLREVRPGEASSPSVRLDGRWVAARYAEPKPPGEVFTQEWQLSATDEYIDDDNAVGVNASHPYDAFELAVRTDFPGSITRPRAVVTRGEAEVPLPGVEALPGNVGWRITIERPEVGVGYALYWDRSV